MECIVFSHPKSGRTRLRLMIGNAMCRELGLPDQRSFSPGRLNGVRIPFFQHDHSSTVRSWTAQQLYEVANGHKPHKPRRVRFKYIVLVRQLGDVMVSWYYHCRFREQVYQGRNISQFIRSPRYGVERYRAQHLVWRKTLMHHPHLLIVSYEQMQHDPHKVLDRVCQHIDLPVSEDAKRKAVEFTSFGNMRRMEETKFFKRNNRGLGYTPDPRGRKMRSGRIGAWKQTLNAEDQRLIEECARKCPWQRNTWKFSKS